MMLAMAEIRVTSVEHDTTRCVQPEWCAHTRADNERLCAPFAAEGYGNQSRVNASQPERHLAQTIRFVVQGLERDDLTGIAPATFKMPGARCE